MWEIQDKFTKSELVIMGWRSHEQNYHMMKRMEETREHGKEHQATQLEKFKRKTSMQLLGEAVKKDVEAMDGEDVPEGATINTDKKVSQKLVEKLRNKEGELDLRKATGEEARRIFDKLGMPLPIMTK